MKIGGKGLGIDWDKMRVGRGRSVLRIGKKEVERRSEGVSEGGSGRVKEVACWSVAWLV